MNRVLPLLCLAVFFPATASSVQLTWSSGPSDRAFTAATRCTLLVDFGNRLPAEWHLLWVADSAGTPVFLAGDSVEVCAGTEADVFRVGLPKTAADSASHRLTAEFCSSAEEPEIARQIVDLAAGSYGKFKVVALDPLDPDSLDVIESNEVTFNWP